MPTQPSELPVIGTLLDAFPISNYRWTQDIIWHNGPILSLFRSPENTPLLFMYSASDAYANRWLAVELLEHTLKTLVQGKLPLYDVFMSPLNNAVFVIDLAPTSEPSDATILCRSAVANPQDIPKEYLPVPAYCLPLVN